MAGSRARFAAVACVIAGGLLLGGAGAGPIAVADPGHSVRDGHSDKSRQNGKRDGRGDQSRDRGDRGDKGQDRGTPPGKKTDKGYDRDAKAPEQKPRTQPPAKVAPREQPQRPRYDAPGQPRPRYSPPGEHEESTRLFGPPDFDQPKDRKGESKSADPERKRTRPSDVDKPKRDRPKREPGDEPGPVKEDPDPTATPEPTKTREPRPDKPDDGEKPPKERPWVYPWCHGIPQLPDFRDLLGGDNAMSRLPWDGFPWLSARPPVESRFGPEPQQPVPGPGGSPEDPGVVDVTGVGIAAPIPGPVAPLPLPPVVLALPPRISIAAPGTGTPPRLVTPEQLPPPARVPGGNEPKVRPGQTLPTDMGTSSLSTSASYRIGYSDYLRTAGMSQLLAVAVPGVAGMLLLTAGGGLIGYRQARAGQAVRTERISRFLN